MKSTKEILLWTLLGLVLGFVAVEFFPAPVLAVSADITLAGNGREVECDGTQRTATIQTGSQGGSIYNKSSASVWVDLNAGTVVTSSGSTSVEIAQGTSIRLPKQCNSFNFKTASGTSYLIFLGP